MTAALMQSGRFLLNFSQRTDPRLAKDKKETAKDCLEVKWATNLPMVWIRFAFKIGQDARKNNQVKTSR